jgi:hypothetical protein
VAGKAEARDVGARARAIAVQEPAGDVVERDHGSDRGVLLVVLGGPPFDARTNDSRAECLREDEEVAFAGAPVAHDAIGVNEAGDGHPVLELAIANRVAADDACACRGGALGPAGQDALEHAERHLPGRKT